MNDTFTVVGGGPAGSAAAVALAMAGARPLIYEQSPFPRHKVCGEFFTPEILPALDRLGMAAEFLERRPAPIAHAELHFSRRSRRFRLPQPGFGLSRWAFDEMLLGAAFRRGAQLRRERISQPGPRAIWAAGRLAKQPRGQRLFGFKTHFAGPAGDAVELYFFPGGYCGICPIEDGRINVCGLATEPLLRTHRFGIESLMAAHQRLAARLAPLEPRGPWQLTGPLRFGPTAGVPPDCYAAGDAACFVDPFTGSGLLAAVQTGVWAAEALLSATPVEGHQRRCERFQQRQLGATTILRGLLDAGWAEPLAAFLPGAWVFGWTRPG